MSKKLVDVLNEHLPACSECAFSEMHETDDSLFRCHRKSPLHVNRETAIWPIVREDDWCGEFRKAKND